MSAWSEVTLVTSPCTYRRVLGCRHVPWSPNPGYPDQFLESLITTAADFITSSRSQVRWSHATVDNGQWLGKALEPLSVDNKRRVRYMLCRWNYINTGNTSRRLAEEVSRQKPNQAVSQVNRTSFVYVFSLSRIRLYFQQLSSSSISPDSGFLLHSFCDSS